MRSFSLFDGLIGLNKQDMHQFVSPVAVNLSQFHHIELLSILVFANYTSFTLLKWKMNMTKRLIPNLRMLIRVECFHLSNTTV